MAKDAHFEIRFCLVHRDGTTEYSDDGLILQRVDGDEFGVAMVAMEEW